jgi:DNA-binding NtrC family response regulator
MWLPAADGKPDTAEMATPTGTVAQRGGVVLLVDDEDLIRSATSRMLADLGYTVIEVTSAAEALQHVDDPRVCLVVSDHLMPGMTGTDLAREVHAVRPRMPILIISGYADLDDVAPDLPRLMKPFREMEFAAALAALK